MKPRSRAARADRKSAVASNHEPSHGPVEREPPSTAADDRALGEELGVRIRVLARLRALVAADRLAVGVGPGWSDLIPGGCPSVVQSGELHRGTTVRAERTA